MRLLAQLYVGLIFLFYIVFMFYLRFFAEESSIWGMLGLCYIVSQFLLVPAIIVGIGLMFTGNKNA